MDSRLLFRDLSTCHDQFAIQICQLLVVERDGRATARQPVRLAKGCERFFRVAKLLAQFNQPIAQPTRSPLGRFKTSVELVNDVGIGYRVSELGGSHRISPSDGNVEYLTLLPAA